jgi:hypothetical protein
VSGHQALYAEVIVSCPHPYEHIMASFVRRQGRLYRLERPLTDGKSRTYEPVTPGDKLHLRCKACEAAGRRTDYQLSWSRLDRELTEQSKADTASRTIHIS